MSGLNSSTLHKELITSNFKTSLSGVCFEFGILMTLNYFYTELAGFPPLYYLWYKSRHILLYRIILILRSSWSHQERWLSSGALCVCPPPSPYLSLFSQGGWRWLTAQDSPGEFHLMDQENLQQALNKWVIHSLSRSPPLYLYICLSSEQKWVLTSRSMGICGSHTTLPQISQI